jgi:hypothetical protein
MEQGQSGQVNHTINDLNTKLGELGDIIQRNGPEVKTEKVTTIIPSRRTAGQVTVSIETLKTTAQNLAKALKNGIPNTLQQDVNDLYDGLVKAINFLNQKYPTTQQPQLQQAAGRRTKRKNSKRRQSKKRRNTKRRRTSRK